jgi:two-component system sensor histidine kinase QseC
MSTIRQRLTQRLLVGSAALLVAGGALAYCTARAALTRQFDEALRAKAMALSSLTEEEGAEIALEFTVQFMREFEAQTNACFFQLWRGDGRVVERSASLRGGNLPPRYGTPEAPQFWNLGLPGGVAARAVGLKFHPLTGEDGAKQAGAGEAILVVAADRRSLDQTLAVLWLVLAGCALLILLLTAGGVPRLLRRELAPLEGLAAQAQRITAETLATRFPTQGLPGELAPIGRRLNDLLQRLQTAFDRERQFSNDLAHEFRTPIAELRSLAELALKWSDARTPEMDRHVLAIALRLESIITRLLAMARSEQSPAAVAVEPVDLGQLAAAVCAPLQARAAGRPVSLEVSAPAAVPIESDPVLLRSIVSNLVENAVEYAPPRGRVRVQAEARDGRFAVRVSNPAEQLSPEDVAHLFDRFWRKDPARASAEHAGLGLSLSRALAASLGYTLVAALNGERCLVLTLSGPAQWDRPHPPISLSETTKTNHPEINAMKITSLLGPLVAGAVLALAAGCATEKSQAELQAQAKISKAQAQQTALARVPNGTVNTCELEEEKGKLVYSFDITNPGAREITEVLVDAMTGEVIAIDKESPEQEAKEKKQERKEKKEKD